MIFWPAVCSNKCLKQQVILVDSQLINMCIPQPSGLLHPRFFMADLCIEASEHHKVEPKLKNTLWLQVGEPVRSQSVVEDATYTGTLNQQKLWCPAQ